jgi:phage head maturation protease
MQKNRKKTLNLFIRFFLKNLFVEIRINNEKSYKKFLGLLGVGVISSMSFGFGF